jgi:hypothetical protein
VTVPELKSDDVVKWGARALVVVAVSFFGWLGNRTAATLDSYGLAIFDIQKSISTMHQYMDLTSSQRLADVAGINSIIADHEARLRQDRETIGQYNVRITGQDTRILTLETLRIPLPAQDTRSRR